MKKITESIFLAIVVITTIFSAFTQDTFLAVYAALMLLILIYDAVRYKK